MCLPRHPCAVNKLQLYARYSIVCAYVGSVRVNLFLVILSTNAVNIRRHLSIASADVTVDTKMVVHCHPIGPISLPRPPPPPPPLLLLLLRGNACLHRRRKQPFIISSRRRVSKANNGTAAEARRTQRGAAVARSRSTKGGRRGTRVTPG